ncbi:alpha/beta hydrolase [Actinomadura sp. DC4]|uniref:alpha/beta hydrolase n=1 Tax=Actinomadura sp. DC4 TaxID=3055069 RepID=UPI0025B24284|nr:alpha/beta hydrolase [Actinomadura sp. DC4]MDN3357728.1 alpha/beta hydrolase [Actinomadura sp. DC4]
MNLPYGYLVTLVYLTVCTFFALVAPGRPRWLGMLAFYLSVAINELPFVAFAYLLAATALGFSQGDLPVPILCGAAVTLAGLSVVAWRGHLAPVAVRSAIGTASRRLPYGRILFRPFFRGNRAVERIADLTYGPAGRRNRLDLYRHRSRPTDAPVLIHFHGGAYKMGRKSRHSLPLLHRLAGKGWICISANYRLQPEAGLGDHLEDAKRVIAWVRDHAHEYGADPDRIFLAGSSAGAHLSALTALGPDAPPIAAVIGLGGYYGQYDADPGSSPLAHVRADAPPFLIVHGDHDSLVPVERARTFAERLRSVSAQPVVYVELPGGQHGFDLFHSLRFEAVINGIEAFTAECVKFDDAAPSGRT